MDYKGLAERLKYYGTTYAIGDNLGREITGTDELMLNAAESITELLTENQALRNAANGFKKQAEAAESRAEKAERERNSVVQFLTSVIRHGTNPCECCKADCIDAGSDDAEYVSQCGMFEWSNPQNDMYVFGEGEE